MVNPLQNPIEAIGEAFFWLIEMILTAFAVLGSAFLGGVIGTLLSSGYSFTGPIIANLIALTAVIAWAEVYRRRGIESGSSTQDDEKTKEELLDALRELADEEKIEVRRKE